ncbi:hypothetical protein IKE79_00550 [Candidatus Saccharibacteria bacterium]|nr:hypothetical protein [Candidatus Saccharibacteria bacterium]
MQRLLTVYNPNSSNFCKVESGVLTKVADFKGCMKGKYAVKKTSFDENVKTLASLLKDGDFVLAAGGDATAAIAANAIMKSGKDATLAVLPYGNFNDLARTLGTMDFRDIFATSSGAEDKIPTTSRNLYPLEIIVDGKFFRYATCYVTIGMTAEAVELFDEPKFRKYMQKGHKSSWRSYLALAKWYFKNRHKKTFIPPFTLNGNPTDPKTSDYAAVSGRSMCRVMKGGDDYLKPSVFRSKNLRTVSFPKLTALMIKSILKRTPGDETHGDVLEFLQPATVEVQAEGEYRVFKDIHTIEIKKSPRPLKVFHGRS